LKEEKMKEEIRVLLVEDSPDDAVFVMAELEKGGLKVQQRRVDTARDMKDAVTKEAWDIILCDYSIPGFGAIPALALLKEMKCDVPIIIISGVIGEESAVDAMKAGAHDFIVKGKYARLVPAVRREIEDNIQLRARDAKAQKQKIEALNQRHLAMQMIMENPQPVIIINEKFDFTLANKPFLNLCGITDMEQLRKMNVRDFKVIAKSGSIKRPISRRKRTSCNLRFGF
jgi:DNA-binding NtrC family response regulator